MSRRPAQHEGRAAAHDQPATALTRVFIRPRWAGILNCGTAYATLANTTTLKLCRLHYVGSRLPMAVRDLPRQPRPRRSISSSREGGSNCHTGSVIDPVSQGQRPTAKWLKSAGRWAPATG